jgi:hypothetical protein
MLFLEEIANHVRLLLPTMQMTTNRADHFRLSGRSAFAERIGLDILVEQLVRIAGKETALLPPPPQRTAQATFTASGSGTAKASSFDAGPVIQHSALRSRHIIGPFRCRNLGAELQRGSLSQASQSRTSNTGLRQLHLAEVCTLSG